MIRLLDLMFKWHRSTVHYLLEHLNQGALYIATYQVIVC